MNIAIDRDRIASYPFQCSLRGEWTVISLKKKILPNTFAPANASRLSLGRLFEQFSVIRSRRALFLLILVNQQGFIARVVKLHVMVFTNEPRRQREIW